MTKRRRVMVWPRVDILHILMGNQSVMGDKVGVGAAPSPLSLCGLMDQYSKARLGGGLSFE